MLSAPEGSVAVLDREGLQVLTAPEAHQAFRACQVALSGQPNAAAGLMLCQITDENVSRAEELLKHAKDGQIVVTLPVQDLLRDSPSEPDFIDLGKVQVGCRTERLFLLHGGEQPAVDKESALTLPSGPFIGRRKELDRLSELITTTRVISVHGSPGIGKSALLRRFVAEQETSFDHGTWLIDLGQVRHGSQALECIARRLEVTQLLGESLGEAIVNTLRSRVALLTLDNCQAVLPEVKKLVSTLANECPQLAIIVGSRKVPRISGETRFRLEGLECPSYAEHWRAMADYEAVAMFVDRAVAADQDFRLSAENAVDVAHLCERLDGNPLAIELVASKVTLLTPSHILGRLQDRFLLFKEPTGENRLQETLTWSYENLSPSAAQVLACLAVFNGSFSLDAVEDLASVIGLPDQGVFWAFEDLLDNSLVSPGPTLASGRQFYLTETIRSFATKKLQALPSKSEVERRHRRWCLDFASKASKELYGLKQADWLAAMDGAYYDIRAVINAGCLPRGDLHTSIKTLLACFPYFVERGYYREALTLCEKVLSVRGAERVPERVRLLNMAGAFAFYLGDWRLCRTYALRSLRAARKCRDCSVEGMAWCSAGLAAQGTGHLARARRNYLRALGRLGPIDPVRTLTVYGNVISLEAEMGLFDCALSHLAEAQPLLERSSDLATIASVYLNGGHLHSMRGDLRSSWDWYYRSLLQAAELRADFSVLLALRGLVTILERWQRYEAAATLVGATKSLRKRSESEPLDERGTYEATCANLESKLGSQEYASAVMEGQAMDREELLDLLRELDNAITA